MSWELLTLESGLEVALEERGRGCASYNVRYPAGSAAEESHRHGLAHLVEHLMFHQVGKDAGYHALVRSLGGYANADTWLDSAEYFACLPLGGIEEVLVLEGRRRRELPALTANGITRELKVIASEAASLRADPAWVWEEFLRSAAFGPADGYGHSVLGDLAALGRLEPAEIATFHRAHYAEAVAVVAVAGAFDRVAVVSVLEQAFEVPAPARPRQARSRNFRAVDAEVELDVPYGVSVLAWAVPGLGRPGHREADLLGDLLVVGGEARLTSVLSPAESYGFRLFPWLDLALAAIWWTWTEPTPELEPAAVEKTLRLIKPPTRAELRRLAAADEVRERRLSEAASDRARRAAALVAAGARDTSEAAVDEEQLAAAAEASREGPMASLVVRPRRAG